MTNHEGPDMGILKPALDQIKASVKEFVRINPTRFVHKPIVDDAMGVLAQDFACVMLALAAMDKHLVNHRSDLPAPFYRRATDAVLDALMALGDLECSNCAGGETAKLGTVQLRHRMVCESCDQLFATCSGCKDDDLRLADAVTIETGSGVYLYHPACAPHRVGR